MILKGMYVLTKTKNLSFFIFFLKESSSISKMSVSFIKFIYMNHFILNFHFILIWKLAPIIKLLLDTNKNLRYN